MFRSCRISGDTIILISVLLLQSFNLKYIRNQPPRSYNSLTKFIFYIDRALDRGYKFPYSGKKWNIVENYTIGIAMFRGILETTIDAKGRTSLPARFREILVGTHGDERFFLTNSAPVDLGGGLHSSGLLIFPYKEWFVFEENFRISKGFTSEQRNSIMRTIISPAQECSADKLGRFLISPSFRKSAFLDREIQFVGKMDKVEIWSMSEWDKVRAQDVKNFPSGTEAAAELGL